MANDSVITQQKLKEYHETYVYPFLNGISTKGDQAFVPCGKIEGFMRTTAPKGYLVCDGTEYLKSAYPSLAALLASVDTAQSTTNFVGSDSDHFKVPDLRGEFLRGKGTNGHTNQGSGTYVGTHQDATGIPFILFKGGAKQLLLRGDNTYNGQISSADKAYKQGTNTINQFNISATQESGTVTQTDTYLVRPTNTSVLYCIAYEDLYLTPGHTYSTDEQVVGTWLGKSLYEKVIEIPSGTWDSTNNQGIRYSSIGALVDKIINYNCLMIDDTANYRVGSRMTNVGGTVYIQILAYDNTHSTYPNQIRAWTNNQSFNSASLYITVQYTKTTD